MAHELRFSPGAIEDIEEVLLYTLARFGERKYMEYAELIRLALEDIRANPDQIPPKRRPQIHLDARTFHIARRGRAARHFLLYRIVGEEFVDVGRLLHDAMDLHLHLPGGYAPN